MIRRAANMVERVLPWLFMILAVWWASQVYRNNLTLYEALLKCQAHQLDLLNNDHRLNLLDNERTK